MFAIDWKNPNPPDPFGFDTESGILDVSELTARVKMLLEGGFPSLGVRGEVSNLRRQASGHSYFTLKDDRSQLSAVLFRGNASRVDLELEDGMEVICFGNVSVYEPRGTYQLIVRDVQEEGVGRLQRAFEALKKRLAEEGLFEEARKRTLPTFPQTLGVVTSPTGAALRDFIQILRRRGFRGTLRVFPSLVQGKEAAGSLVQALDLARKDPSLDLLVIGRGGGSLEDLWPFNEESVVRALADFPVPTISAVGHQIDFALTDFAADVRAETPSSAAELVSSLWMEFIQRFLEGKQALWTAAEMQIQRLGQDLDQLQYQLQGLNPELKVVRMRGRLETLAGRLGAGLNQPLQFQKKHLDRLSRRLERYFPEERVLRRRDRLKALKNRLHQASVESTLKRGFALVRDARGNPVMSADALQSGAAVTLQFRDGERQAEVD